MNGAGLSLGALDGVQGPGEAAELAAEALRAVNHLTIGAPSPGVPGWEEISDLYRVLGELRFLTDRLSQVLRQLVQHLERTTEVCSYQSDAGTRESPEALVAAAVLALEEAQHHVCQAGSHLNTAHMAIAHLYTEPVATERGSSQQMER